MNSELTLGCRSGGTLPPTTIHSLSPFGVQLLAHRSLSVIDLDVEWLQALLFRHKVVVLRGFEAMDKNHFITAARRFGDLLESETGYVLEAAARDPAQGLELEDEALKDGLFSRTATPFHWDRVYGRPVPGTLFYQCLAAPEPGQGGETIFCDTSAVMSRVTSTDLAAWCATEIAYRAEMRTQHGGMKRRPLVDEHPVTGDNILRFDEPTDWHIVNSCPDAIEIYQDGQAISQVDASNFLEEFIPGLYHEGVVYAHRWNAGDFIFADNHALLHGRRSFEKTARRRLRRIHIV
jgi:alpha-ketoglutarate-dependent taurine dioxygenase